MLLLLPTLVFYLFLTTFLLYIDGVTSAKVRYKWKRGTVLQKEMRSAENELSELQTISKRVKQKRRPKYCHRRLNMDEHFNMCEYTNGFQTRYHMSRNAFDGLVKILDIKVNEKQSRNSTSDNTPISSVMVIAIGIRFLGGEKVKLLADAFGTSISSINRVVDKFLNAVDHCSHPRLSTNLLPVSYQDRIRVSKEWMSRSQAKGIFWCAFCY